MNEEELMELVMRPPTHHSPVWRDPPCIPDDEPLWFIGQDVDYKGRTRFHYAAWYREAAFCQYPVEIYLFKKAYKAGECGCGWNVPKYKHIGDCDYAHDDPNEVPDKVIS